MKFFYAILGSFMQSTPFIMDTVGTSRVCNGRSIFKSNVCNLFLPGI